MYAGSILSHNSHDDDKALVSGGCGATVAPWVHLTYQQVSFQSNCLEGLLTVKFLRNGSTFIILQ